MAVETVSSAAQACMKCAVVPHIARPSTPSHHPCYTALYTVMHLALLDHIH